MQKRALGYGETYVKYCYDHGNGTTGVSAAIQLSGPLTKAIVYAGLDSLQKRHPLLRARFCDHNRDHNYFEIDDIPLNVPLNVVQRTNPEQWKEIYEQRLNEPFAKRKGYLWQATFLSGEGKKTPDHELIVSFHHTIIDGISLGYFFRDFLKYCSALSSGENVQIESLPFLPNVEALLNSKVAWPDYLAQSEKSAKQLSKIQRDLFTFEKYVPLSQRRTKALYLEHSKQELKHMVSLCRKNKTTLTGLLCAALLIAIHNVKHKKSSKDHTTLKQVSMIPVDLRTYCNTVLDMDYIGCFVSAVTTVHSTSKDTSLWSFARSFLRKINKAIEEQAFGPQEFDKQLNNKILDSIKTGAMEKKFHLGAGVTNYGVLDLPINYGPFRINGFYSGAARHWGDWLMLLHTASVGGRLLSCFCYEEPLLSEKTARKIVLEFTEIINSAISS